MPDEGSSTVSRRKFLQVVGVAGGGAAVLSGCSTRKVEKLVPYLVQSEDQVPGSPPGTPAPAPNARRGAGST